MTNIDVSTLSFYFQINNQLEKGEITLSNNSNIPLLEEIIYLSQIRVAFLKNISREEIMLYQNKMHSFRLALLWVAFLKDGSIRRKHFIKTFPYLANLENLGNLMFSCLELSIETLNFIDKYELPISISYSSGLIWWKLCMLDVLNSYFKEEPFNLKKRREEWRDDFTKLKHYQNPSSEAEKIKYPHLNYLIDSAIYIAKHNLKEGNNLRKARKDFREFYWKNI